MSIDRIGRSRLAPVVASVAASSFLLAACQQQSPLSVHGAGDAASDVCFKEHQDLVNAQNFFTEQIVQGAVMGAVLGGLAGALVGGDNRGQAIAIGAASGAVIGGTAGYFNAKQKDAQDRAALAASIHQDLTRENEEIDRATVAFAKVRNCRIGAAQQIKDAHRAGRLTRAEAAQRLDRLRQQYESDIAVAESISANMAKRAESFRTASVELAKIEGVDPATLSSAQPAVVRGDMRSVSKRTQVRDRPTGKSKVIATLNKGDVVEVMGPAEGAKGWHEVVIADGRTGYAPSSQLTAAAPAKSSPQPAATVTATKDARGVAQLTSTSQIKQASFSQSVQQAKADAPLFDLSGEARAFSPVTVAVLHGVAVAVIRPA